MSVGQIYDDGFAINFDASHVYLQKGRLLLLGTIYPASGLYYIDFDSPTHPHHAKKPIDLSLAPLESTGDTRAYSAHHMTTRSDLIQYLHRAAWSSVP